MTDIAVIKMIISVAVWRIYPSWVNDKLRAWEGLSHSRMFERGSRGTIFVRSSILSLFLPELCPFRRVFMFPALFKDLAPNVQVNFGFDDVLEVFLKTPLRHRALLRTRLRPRVFFENFLFFPKKSRCYLPDSYGDPQPEKSTLVMVRRRKLEWKLDFRALARSSADSRSSPRDW